MGARGRPCQICLSPELKVRVEATRETGASYREIAALVGLDKFKIARHFKHSASQAQPIAETENLDELQVSDQRLATLLARLEAQYSAAVAVGDSKVALDITKVSARLEAEKHNRLVARKQADLDSVETDGRPSVAWMDALHRKGRELTAYREKRIAVALASGYCWCPLCSLPTGNGNLIWPGHIAEKWQLCKKIYDDFCDEAERQQAAKGLVENAEVSALQQ
jgi:hypothetical protein